MLLIFLLKNYRIHFLYLSKDETINLLNLDLTEKSEILPKKNKSVLNICKKWIKKLAFGDTDVEKKHSSESGKPNFDRWCRY